MTIHASISIEQQLREAHKARQARFAAAAARVQKKPETPPAAPVADNITLPLRMENPRDFAKALCAERGITYAQLVEENRRKDMAVIRKEIIRATHEKFPTCSMPQLGKIFKRNHTTILWCVGKLAAKEELVKLNAARDKQALELYHEGVSMVDIGIRLGLSETTVKGIKHRNKWGDRPRIQTIDYEKITGPAHELYMSGYSLEVIGERFGVSSYTIRKLKIANGWPDRNVNGPSLSGDKLKQASDMWKAHTAREIAKTVGISVDTLLGIAMRNRELFPGKGKGWKKGKSS